MQLIKYNFFNFPANRPQGHGSNTDLTDNQLALLHSDLGQTGSQGDLKGTDQLGGLSDPHRSDLLATTQSSLPPSDVSSIDRSLSLLPRYPGISELRFNESRIGESRINDPRHMLQSSSSFSYPSSNSNIGILEHSRPMTTLPMSVSHNNYPVVSPHGFLSSSVNPPTTIPGSSSYLTGSPSAAVLPTSLLYPHLYPNTSSSSYNPNIYIHTNEGRTLELLGGSDPSSRIPRCLTPPPPQLQPALPLDSDKQAVHGQHSRHPAHGQDGDPSSVWRPY